MRKDSVEAEKHMCRQRDSGWVAGGFVSFKLVPVSQKEHTHTHFWFLASLAGYEMGAQFLMDERKVKIIHLSQHGTPLQSWYPHSFPQSVSPLQPNLTHPFVVTLHSFLIPPSTHVHLTPCLSTGMGQGDEQSSQMDAQAATALGSSSVGINSCPPTSALSLSQPKAHLPGFIQQMNRNHKGGGISVFTSGISQLFITLRL